MYGYVSPERAHLYMKDFDLYRSFYCGVCKSMQRQYGNTSRFTVNYDVTFLSVLLHNFLGEDVQFEKLKCITKPFTDRKAVKGNILTDLLASFNVVSAYYSLEDKVLDEDSKMAKTARAFMKPAYKRASKRIAGLDEEIKKRYASLRVLEENGCDSVDRASGEFAEMMGNCVNLIIIAFEKEKNIDGLYKPCYNEKDKEEFIRFCRLVGKWIYMIDALDDLEKDVKKGNYNPFFKAYGIKELKELMDKNGDEVSFTFKSCLDAISESFTCITFRFNTDFIKNVIYQGMPLMTKGIMRGEKCETIYSKF